MMYDDDDGYPHFGRDDDRARRAYERYSGGTYPTLADAAYWVFGQPTILRECVSTEEMIFIAIEQMDELAQDLRDEGETEWLDYFGWDRDPLMDTLYDIRSLPEADLEPPVVMAVPTRRQRRHSDRVGW